MVRYSGILISSRKCRIKENGKLENDFLLCTVAIHGVQINKIAELLPLSVFNVPHKADTSY